MKRIYKFFLLCCLSLVGFSSCEEDLDSTTPVPKKKEATYLLYLVGENDLSYLMNANIQAMMTGFEKSDISAYVLVYADMDASPELYLLDKAENGVVRKKTVKTYSDQNSVDPEVMQAVIKDVFDAYPAQRKGITFSSHADGSLYQPNTVRTRSFGMEKIGNQYYGMNITDMRQAMEGGPYLDYIMFDACLMASVETAYELKDCAHYLLAAPNTVPGEGFPYHKVMHSLLQMNAEGLAEAGRTYMDHFHTNDYTWDDFVSVSVADLTRMDSLAHYMNLLCTDEEVQQRTAQINLEHMQFFEPDFPLYDYGQWVDSVGMSKVYADSVRQALDKVMVYKAHSEYASVNAYTDRLQVPVKEGAFSGFNGFVPDAYLNVNVARKQFFTTLRWYRDAGLFRCLLYNIYETDE